MQCLIDLLRGAEASGPESLEDWKTLLELAEEQHVLPWIVRLIREREITRRGASLPAEVENRVREAEHDAVVAAFLQTAEVSEILQQFAGQGVGAILLKGPSLAQRVYGAAALRISRDLDLLVRKEEFPAAAALLRKLDYVPESLSDDYHQSWRRGASVVELHFDVENPLAIDFEVEKVWQRARPGRFNGVPLWELAPPDELLLLCVHGVRHRFEYLGLVLDIALAVHALAPKIGPLYPIESRNDDAAIVLLLGLAMGRKIDPSIASLLSIPAAEEVSAHAERVAERLWEELLCARPTPTNWRSQHKFFLELEWSAWRKLRRRAMHLRILGARLIGPDVDFAAMYGLHRPWQARLLRPARLAFGRIQRKSIG